MKHFPIFPGIKPQILIFFSVSLIISNINCDETLESRINNICLKAGSSVKSFFEEKQELPKKFQNFKFDSKISENELKTAIKFILIDENIRNNFIQTKNNEKIYLQIIIKVITIISVLLILDFEIHFFLRLCFKKDIFEPSFTNFYKISPFYWIFYFILNKQKKNALYEKFLNNRTSRKNKYLIFIFGIIIFIIIIVIFVLTYFVANEYDNSSQVTNNVLCSSIKILNEIQNGKQLKKDKSRLIGFKDINSFLNELIENKNVFKNYFTNYTESYNEINNNLNEWENYLFDIQNNLTDLYSLKYFFFNYPSDPTYIDKINCKFSEPESCKKCLFQTELIYNYNTYDDDTSKTLYEFDNNLYEKIETLLKKLETFEKIFMTSENSLNSIFENQNYKNGISIIESIINIYIKQLLEIDKVEIFDKFTYSYLSYIYSFDFILLIFLGFSTLLVLLYVEYYCVKKFFFGRVVILFVFYNIIFIILNFCIFETKILKKINIIFSYIKEISKGIEFILNDKMKEYENLFNEESNSHFKNISLIMNFNNTEMNNNLFNYIKYYINNEGELENLINDKILHINKTQLIIINYTLNEVINNENILVTLNSEINKFSEILLKLINNGLEYSTNFRDLSSSGYMNTNLESPITYLSYVNFLTKKTSRETLGYKEIECDEIWNISTFDYYPYKYKSRDLVLCENCNNTYSDDKILLNFMEYSIDEIEKRYNNLKNENYSEIYYEIMYYFKATEKLRDKKIFEQLQDLYEMNENLKTIQKNIFNSIQKTGYIAKKIILIYENILNKYEKENIIFNYTEFIRDDLNYLLGQININFSQKISKEYKNHTIINIMCLCTCFSLIIFYILFTKEIKYYKTDSDAENSKSNIDDASSIDKNIVSPQAVIPNFIKIDKIDVRNNHTNPGSSININIDVNVNKYLKKNKSVALENNIFDNDINKYINNIKITNKKGIKMLDTRKNLLLSKFMKNNPPTEFNESRNDESGYGLGKGLITENKKAKNFDLINKESQKHLNK